MKKFAFNFFKIIGFILIIVIAFSCNNKQENQGKEEKINPKETLDNYGKVTFSSSDTILVNRFNWAKKQALFYAHHGGDKVGLWYEAALPNRQAFCMRDVSHQIIGANVLGLQAHNLNMLNKFAINISESKDWCTYWEINKDDLPAPVDYRNDKEFWYNLPANFTVLDACYRQYLWTGDQTYLTDSVFLNFYSKSVNEYVDRWDLGLDKIMSRDRFINTLQPLDSVDPFHICRGIPSYKEGNPIKRYLGGDMFNSLRSGYMAYADILSVKGNKTEADVYYKKAEDVKDFFNKHWWNEEGQYYYDDLSTDGTFSVLNPAYSVGLGNSEKEKSAIDYMANNPVNIETQSHYAEIFYEYGKNQEAYNIILSLTDANKKRREYPEVSYTVVGVYVSGMMGIEPNAANRKIETLSRLIDKTEWAQIENLPVLGNKISLYHKGNRKSTLINQFGEKFSWTAKFMGKHDTLIINGKSTSATQEELKSGQIVSIVKIKVASNQKITVTIPVK